MEERGWNVNHVGNKGIREGEVTEIEVCRWKGQGNRKREGRPAWLS